MFLEFELNLSFFEEYAHCILFQCLLSSLHSLAFLCHCLLLAFYYISQSCNSVCFTGAQDTMSEFKWSFKPLFLFLISHLVIGEGGITRNIGAFPTWKENQSDSKLSPNTDFPCIHFLCSHMSPSLIFIPIYSSRAYILCICFRHMQNNQNGTTIT